MDVLPFQLGFKPLKCREADNRASRVPRCCQSWTDYCNILFENERAELITVSGERGIAVVLFPRSIALRPGIKLDTTKSRGFVG